MPIGAVAGPIGAIARSTAGVAGLTGLSGAVAGSSGAITGSTAGVAGLTGAVAGSTGAAAKRKVPPKSGDTQKSTGKRRAAPVPPRVNHPDIVSSLPVVTHMAPGATGENVLCLDSSDSSPSDSVGTTGTVAAVPGSQAKSTLALKSQSTAKARRFQIFLNDEELDLVWEYRESQEKRRVLLEKRKRLAAMGKRKDEVKRVARENLEKLEQEEAELTADLAKAGPGDF